MTIEAGEPYNRPENDTNRNQWRLLTGLLVGPVVYSVYFWAVYLLVEAVCRQQLLQDTGLQAAVVGLTVAAVGIILAFARLTYRRTQNGGSTDAQRNRRFIEQAGLWLDGFFVVVTLVTGIPILFLELCRWV